MLYRFFVSSLRFSVLHLPLSVSQPNTTFLGCSPSPVQDLDRDDASSSSVLLFGTLTVVFDIVQVTYRRRSGGAVRSRRLGRRIGRWGNWSAAEVGLLWLRCNKNITLMYIYIV